MNVSESPLDEFRRRAPRAIVIGGSAGSIEALRTLAPCFPQKLPVLVVLHIAAEASSDWSKVLPATRLTVREAEDKELAAPGTLFVAPPDYHLLVDEKGLLSLSVDAPVHHARPSIDILFESAAWAYREGLLAIVLSGANSDGAGGLAKIRQAGGLCWVQAPDSAPAPAMPRAALEAVPDARALTLDQMAEVLRDRA
jgi:two-component system chemotaxis response regulator CheB